MAPTDPVQTIKPHILKQHITSIRDISKQQLGKGYLTESRIEKAIQTGNTHYLLVALEEEDEITIYKTPQSIEEVGFAKNIPPESNIIGFCLYGVYSDGALDEYIHVNREEYPEKLKQSMKTGIIRTVAVHPSHTGNGIGSEMVTNAIDLLSDMDEIDEMCIVGWKSEDGCHIESVLEDTAFNPEIEYEKYWTQSSLREGYTCSFCGAPPCMCNAVVFLT